MPGQIYNTSHKPFLRIVGGNVVQTVDKGTEGARYREYETRDGQKGSKWELVFKSWEGKIQGIEFRETDFGESCVIDLGDAYFTLNVTSRYFQDFGSKIFSADLDKPVILHPYDMEIDGKRKSGISLQQSGEKLKNYFYDGKENLHGFPKVDKEKMMKKSYWKVYFVEVADFLIERLKELKFTKAPVNDAPPYSEKEAPPEDEISIDQIPF